MSKITITISRQVNNSYIFAPLRVLSGHRIIFPDVVRSKFPIKMKSSLRKAQIPAALYNQTLVPVT